MTKIVRTKSGSVNSTGTVRYFPISLQEVNGTAVSQNASFTDRITLTGALVRHAARQ